MRQIAVDKIQEIIEAALRAQAYELVDVQWKNDGGWVLRVFIDGPGGITLEDCTRVSRLVSATLDVADLISQSYNLEVSSPGLDRPLKKEADFQRFLGRQAKIKTRRPLPSPADTVGRRNFSGTLVGVDAGRVRIDVGDQVCDVPIVEVERAQLVPEFSSDRKV